MINRNNIVEYISFLYKKKFNQPAPQDLLDSWSNLNENETSIHLNGLYRHWNLDQVMSSQYEQEFLALGAKMHNPIMPPPPTQQYNNQQQYAPPQQHQNQYYPAPKPKSKSGLVIGIFAALIIGAAAFYFWELSKKDTDAPPAVKATDSANINKQPEPEVVKPIKPAEPVQTEEDKTNARVIHDLLYAESTHDFDKIYQYFSPNLERYWAINYPTYDELRNEYNNTWSKTENNEHSNVRVNKVAEKTYDVLSTYSFYSLKDQKQKRVDSKIRFVFNNENKIIKAYKP